MQLHAIAGTPRSGSTLLCNLLAQRSDVRVSATSHLATALGGICAGHTKSLEVKSELIKDEQRTLRRLRQAVLGYVEGWYAEQQGANEVVFDKSRAWTYQVDYLRWLFPTARCVTIVRDLRAVLASCERQNVRTAAFNHADALSQRTLWGRSDTLFAPEGTIGLALRGVEDAIRRYGRQARQNPGGCPVVFLRYEDLVQDPGRQMARLERELQLTPHAYDFENVRCAEPEVDALFHHKYPHDGTGAVSDQAPDWADWVSPDVEELIAKTFPVFMGYFGYLEKELPL